MVGEAILTAGKILFTIVGISIIQYWLPVKINLISVIKKLHPGAQHQRQIFGLAKKQLGRGFTERRWLISMPPRCKRSIDLHVQQEIIRSGSLLP